MNAAPKILVDQVEENIMEIRVAKLELQVEHILESIDDIKVDMRGVQGDLKAANDAIAALTADVGKINATLPHLATAAQLSAVEGTLGARISTVEGALTTKITATEGTLNARISSVEGALNARINAMETRIIKWIVVTMIGVAGLAFSIARFVPLLPPSPNRLSSLGDHAVEQPTIRRSTE